MKSRGHGDWRKSSKINFTTFFFPPVHIFQNHFNGLQCKWYQKDFIQDHLQKWNTLTSPPYPTSPHPHRNTKPLHNLMKPHATIAELQKALWNQHGASQFLAEPLWNHCRTSQSLVKPPQCFKKCHRTSVNHHRTSQCLTEPKQNLNRPHGTIIEAVQNYHRTLTMPNKIL